MGPKDEKKRQLIAPYMDLGLNMAVAVLIGTALGYWLDRQLHTTPVFLVIGVFCGATAGFFNIYRTVYPPQKDGPPKG